MYTCSNCGTVFDGGVCPNCCTMRPAAAVLGTSGRILRSCEAAVIPPQEQAERFAEELEYTRKAETLRRQQKRHADEMRRRAAELAQAAERRQAKSTGEQQRYARQAEKAARWQRKAPYSRADQSEEVEVTMPDALRSLKIDSKNADRPVSANAADGVQLRKRKPAPLPVVHETSRIRSYPASPQISRHNERRLASMKSEKIDAAWRSFASKEAASGRNVNPRLPEETGRDTRSTVPKPPAVPMPTGSNEK